MRRTWHDSTGKFSVEATFLSADDNTVTLQKVDGEEVKLPHNRLCKEDIDFLNHYIGNSKTPGDGKASPHPPAKIPRETKLAVVEKERARFASPFNNSIADATAAIADIQAKIGRLEKLGVKSQRSEKSYRELTEKLASEKQRLQKLNQELETINDRYKQQELAIIAEDLLPGEGKPIRVEDRWYTKEQFDELVAKQDAVKNQGKFRETGIQLAEWVITNLQQSYEMSADFNSVILIREARVRFVRPSAATVYSLAPTENQVVLRGSINDSSTDDSFSFTVSWKTRGGQVFQKNGYVEIGYGRDGTAYLLGVDMPFLDNPMNGAMFVTRSTLDEAIGKAFGR